MRFLSILILTLCFTNSAFSQSAKSDSVEVELHTGDYIEIAPVKKAGYKYLMYYRKTRWVGESKPYDTATGLGFYTSFFTSGDFDVKSLPDSYAGKRFRVLGLEVLTDSKTGKDISVVYLKGLDPNSIIWIDFYKAVEAEEIKFIH